MSQQPDTLTDHHMEVPVSHAEAGADHGGTNSAISGAMFFWFLTIFVVAALILKKYAFGPILTSLDQREEEIEQSLENADHLQRELATLDEKVQSKLDDADQKVRGLIDSGREAAREAGRAIEAKAKEEAQIVRENAQREIAAEQGKAENALRIHSAETAVEMAMKLLHRELDAKGRKELTDQLIGEI
ncbi:MAG: F0F1 ATP synthase subunit B [Kiritimatiellia bacterium]